SCGDCPRSPAPSVLGRAACGEAEGAGALTSCASATYAASAIALATKPIGSTYFRSIDTSIAFQILHSGGFIAPRTPARPRVPSSKRHLMYGDRFCRIGWVINE